MEIVGVCLSCLPQSGSTGVTLATAVAMLALAIYRSATAHNGKEQGPVATKLCGWIGTRVKS